MSICLGINSVYKLITYVILPVSAGQAGTGPGHRDDWDRGGLVPLEALVHTREQDPVVLRALAV